MKKFERLLPEQRKEEICTAALQLFKEKGFAATTMENIVEKVSLSKGGVYRIYSSTADILSDLMIGGMHLRNRYYEECVLKQMQQGGALTAEFLVGMIVDSLLLYPDVSSVYVEFLWEKQRNPKLEALYETICASAVEDTMQLIERCGAQELFSGRETLVQLTELMNGAVLSMHVLGWRDRFENCRDAICSVMLHALESR